MTAVYFLYLLQPFPIPKEWVDQYLDAYFKSRGDYGWAGWLFMSAVFVVGVAFLWLVVRAALNRIAGDAKGSFDIAVKLIGESNALMSTIQATMVAAAVERQVLINKVDALEAVCARLALVVEYQGKAIDELKIVVKEAGKQSVEAIMACRIAEKFRQKEGE